MLTSKDFPRIITKQSIVLVYQGRHNTIRSDHPNYDKLIAAFRDGEWDQVPTLVSPEAAVEELSDGRLRVEDGQVYLTDEDGGEFTVSPSLNDNIMLHIEKGLDMKPLVEFGLKLQNNTSSRSIAQLFDWIQNTSLTITEEGDFIAYKGVRKNFKDSRESKFDNSPGKVVSMPRNQVDDDPTRTCSHGLHVGAFSYAETFSEITVSVKVNPADVVAVPTDYQRSKMRVCKYTVIESIERPVTSPVYNDYDDSCDDDDDCDYSSDDDCYNDDY